MANNYTTVVSLYKFSTQIEPKTMSWVSGAGSTNDLFGQSWQVRAELEILLPSTPCLTFMCWYRWVFLLDQWVEHTGHWYMATIGSCFSIQWVLNWNKSLRHLSLSLRWQPTTGQPCPGLHTAPSLPQEVLLRLPQPAGLISPETLDGSHCNILLSTPT